MKEEINVENMMYLILRRLNIFKLLYQMKKQTQGQMKIIHHSIATFSLQNVLVFKVFSELD